MTSKIIAIQGNHPSQLNPKTDTTIFLANEIQNKDYKLFYFTPQNLSIINKKVIAKGSFIKFSYTNKNFYKIIKNQKLDLAKCKFILIRQDPPFNLEYISTTFILENIKNKVKIINDPSSIRNISEKLYSAKYLKFMPPTIFTQNMSEIKNFFKRCKRVVIKPIHSFGGNDIYLLNKFEFNLINRFIKKYDHIMCQKFLPDIRKGDKRVFIINGKVRGAIKRIPKKGSNLANISQGGKAFETKLNKKELRMSKAVAKSLSKNKIFFAGIDLINGYLIGDINVTSPTGLPQYKELTGINLAKDFWNEAKRLK